MTNLETDPTPEARTEVPQPASARAGLQAPGLAEKAFNGLAYGGLPVLLVLTALMALAQLFVLRDLWFSDEVRHADVYMRLAAGGNWLVLNLNGLPYPDKPPLYFWFLRALDLAPGVAPPLLFFLGTALSAMLFVGAAWLLAKATGHDRRTAFAAGLMTLSCLFVAGLAHYPRMDLLFAAVITLSSACFYRAWIKPSAPLWLLLAFFLAGAATLIKGPLALAFVLLPSVLFLLWRGTPGRLNGRDGLLGFGLMLLLLGAWMGVLVSLGQGDYLEAMLGTHTLGRTVNAWHHAGPWWYYLAAVPLVWLPWIFLPLFVRWPEAARNLPVAWKNRKTDGGRAWLWITLVIGLAVLSAVSAKIAIYFLPLVPALAVVSARALLRLTPGRSRAFFLLLAVFFALLGLIFVLAGLSSPVAALLPESWQEMWATALPPIAHAYLETADGLPLMGAVLILLGGALVFLVRRSFPGGALLVTTLGVILLMQPYALEVAPSLGPMLSPRPQAEELARRAAEGYTPASYRVYPGVYSYYLNEARRAGAGDETGAAPMLSVLEPENREGLDRLLAERPRVALAMREKDWNRWENKPEGLQLVLRQWMVDQPYVIVLWDRPEPAVPEPAVPEPLLPVEPPVTEPAAPESPGQPTGPAESSTHAPAISEPTTPEPAEAAAPPATPEALPHPSPPASPGEVPAGIPAGTPAGTPSEAPAEMPAEAPAPADVPALAPSTPEPGTAPDTAAGASADTPAPPTEAPAQSIPLPATGGVTI